MLLGVIGLHGRCVRPLVDLAVDQGQDHAAWMRSAKDLRKKSLSALDRYVVVHNFRNHFGHTCTIAEVILGTRAHKQSALFL